jgi:recombination associated protein RdgC
MSGLWLRAITCLNLIDFPKFSADDLAEKLDEQRFSPCSTLERERHGFIPVFEQESLVRKVNDVLWLQIMSEVKPVPGAVVKRLLRERIAKISEEEGRKVGKKEQKELKELVIEGLVSTAVPVQSTLTIMIDPSAKMLVISSTSNKKVDLTYKLLLRCLDDLNMTPMQFAKTIPGQMSELLLDEDTSLFKTDSSLVLKGPGSPAASVRFAQHSLAGAEIVTHLNAGLRPVELELSWKDRLTFVLTEKFEIKKLNFLELVTSEFESTKADDPVELIDAMLMVQTGELREMVTDLTDWLGGAAEETQPSGDTGKAAA